MPRSHPSATRQRPPTRVVVEHVQPEIDAGRFPIKRIAGDRVVVEADVFADGHDGVSCQLLYRREADAQWLAAPMLKLGNDRWRGTFTVDAIGRYRYTVEGWLDELRTWRRELVARIGAGQDVGVDILIGADLIDGAAGRAEGAEARDLREWARALRETKDPGARNALALSAELAELAARHPDLPAGCRYERELAIVVDRERARFSAWYEVFPRNCTHSPGRHGTLRDLTAWLPYVADMGFDVVYLPPIHPIGRTERKGPNNVPGAGPGVLGSPWAIGAQEGGHTAIHPELGTLEDFRELVAAARALGLEIALDIAYQCSPDHPYVKEHPDWFRRRPDGTIQYAENPPKKYQDIYPFDFDSADWRNLWEELRRVIEFWAEQGVRIVRVDNPHTKSLAFWEWAISELKTTYPDLILLSEAFTRPRLMYRLAKLGFTQSYTYFTWRNTKGELTEYFRELTATEVREYFRPNLWPNTPDILHEYLQKGGPPAFAVRGLLASTLGASYGVFGPAFELCENVPREPGSEEYLHSDKYEIRVRDLDASGSLRPLLTRLNQIRRDNVALQSDEGLRFHETDNPQLLCYSKATADRSNVVLMVVNLDVAVRQAGWVTLDLDALGVTNAEAYEVQDLLDGRRFTWKGPRNYVELAPVATPGHVLRLDRRTTGGDAPERA